jgi:5-methylcytosine-specific restriction protein B
VTAVADEVVGEVARDAEWEPRCRQRLHEVLAMLGERDGPAPAEEIKVAAEARTPLTAYDRSTLKSGEIRAWDALFRTLDADCLHAGWLHSGTAGYRLTREGRGAVTRCGPAELAEEAAVRHKAWLDARDETLPSSDLDPGKAILHSGDAAAHARRACAPLLSAWRDRDSAFVPGTPLWSAETTGTLAAYLRGDAVGAELSGLDHDPARMLAAEALALLLAPFGDVSGTEKRARIHSLLLAAGTDPPGLPVPLSADLESGFVPGGKTLAADPIGMLRSFVAILEHWWAQPAERLGEVWRDPRAWRNLLAEVDATDERIVSLLNLVAHADSFTPLLRAEDRKKVVEAFSDRLVLPTKDVDLDLFTIVLALQKEYGGHGVDLTAQPLLGAWSGRVDAGGAWLLRARADQRDLAAAWIDAGVAGLAAGRLRRLPARLTRPALTTLADDAYADLPALRRETMRKDLLTFVFAMRPGDLVAVVDGGSLRLGHLGDAEPRLETQAGTRLLIRPVTWDDEGLPLAELPGKVRDRLRFSGDDVVNLTDVLAELEGATAPSAARIDLSCDTAALAAALHHADASWLDELVSTLNERRQVLIEGPAGSGKTYAVQKLLEACGLSPSEQVVVQFHPTYSYEDFMEGFRPSSLDGRLAVVPGPLRRLADEARRAPDRPYVLVIDEIDRANLVKVFGELLYLLEYRDAEIELLYGDGSERFSLPSNLFLIGTASVLRVDPALRRRFGFLAMGPDEPALAGVLARWCRANGVPGALGELRERINATMREHGIDPGLEIGAGYFMRPSLRDPEALRRLWRRELLPMLQELDEAEYPFETWCAELGLVPGHGR